MRVTTEVQNTDGQAPEGSTGQEPTTPPQEGTTTTGQEPAGGSQSTETEQRLLAELKAVRAEAAKYRKAAKDAEDARKAREEAELSDLERATRRAEDLEAQTTSMQQQIRSMALENAVTAKAVTMRIIDPHAALALMDHAGIEWDDAGRPDMGTVDAALTKLVEAKPYLVGKQTVSTGAPANPSRSAGEPPEDPAARRQRIMSGGGTRGVLFDPAAAAQAGGGVVLKQ